MYYWPFAMYYVTTFLALDLAMHRYIKKLYRAAKPHMAPLAVCREYTARADVLCVISAAAHVIESVCSVLPPPYMQTQWIYNYFCFDSTTKYVQLQ